MTRGLLWTPVPHLLLAGVAQARCLEGFPVGVGLAGYQEPRAAQLDIQPGQMDDLRDHLTVCRRQIGGVAGMSVQAFILDTLRARIGTGDTETTGQTESCE